MADKPENMDDSAEKAYAEAAAQLKPVMPAVPAKSAPVAPKAAAELEVPAAVEAMVPAKVAVAPTAPAKPMAPAKPPVTAKPIAMAKPKAPTKPKVLVKSKAPARRKVAVKPKALAKPKPPVVTVKPATPVKVAPVAAAPKVASAKLKTSSAQPKPVPAKAPVAKAPISPPPPFVTELKEMIMATAKTPDYTAMMTEMQTRAKDAYEKGTSAMSDITDFAKGNVEAIVESSKIMAGAVQDMGKTCAEEAKSAYETMTADLKDMAAIKSPTELFQLQGKIMRRNFDAFVATGSKNSDSMMKLASDAFAPITSRVNLAAEKISKVA